MPLPPILLATYEPDEPEGSSASKSQYMSFKDIKVIGILIVVFGLISVPIFKGFRDARDEQVCKKNLKDIANAITAYSVDNGDRMPPLFAETADKVPSTFDGGLSVWASQLTGYANTRISFECPAAEDDEMTVVLNQDTRKEGINTMNLSYGMYVAMQSVPHLLLGNPDSTMLIAETSNHGAMDSYNPTPYVDSAGNMYPDDGFVIGYDNDNWQFDDKTQFVTRLAFRNANGATPYSGKDVMGRHGKTINFIYVSGALGKMSASDARVNQLHPNLTGLWSNR